MSLVRWPQVSEAIWTQFSPWGGNALEEWLLEGGGIGDRGVGALPCHERFCVHRRLGGSDGVTVGRIVTCSFFALSLSWWRAIRGQDHIVSVQGTGMDDGVGPV